MDKKIRIALVGVPGLRDTLRFTAERLMPSLFETADIEYDIITPHGNATRVAAEIFGLQPDILLLGNPQQEVSCWDIVEKLKQYPEFPIIRIKLAGRAETSSKNSKPTGGLNFLEGDLGGICGAIEAALVPRKPNSTTDK